MSGDAIPDRTRLPLDVLDRIDRVCDRFEAAWANGDRPRIEDYLGEVAAPYRRALLRDLLAAEIAARRRGGETPEPGDYRDRLSGEGSTIDSAFGKAHADEASPPDLDATVDRAPTDPTVSVHRPIAEGPGTTIGPYKLLQQIGEGGMGTVFMAEQTQPVRRKVALKVIKPGMDTGQVIARFEAERQALAMMDHPNIARVLDVGATETGRPFFVMELVKGVPITEYCDRNNLSPKERLELFIPVCQAIQHAHQKGIIHRDIKPSNVLVALHDGVPVPKVIDFGVAKAIQQRLTERTMFTEFGAIIGTLEYMSPEQAEMGALDIDTRSDIYSLGVLLYELLTGSTPLERAKLRKVAYSEILKRIRDEEPPKPSTRLSESKDALPSISAQRKMEPARLTKLVRGDLDWIVMKSLEKDRTRRYETATGFARDIQRYLDGDAVEACPPSATYKLKKFARKHCAALATAGAFAILLVAATAVSAWLAVWAMKSEKLAKTQQARAQDREQRAINAVRRFGDVVRDTPELKNNPELVKLRATLLKEPQIFFKSLRDRLQADQETTAESLVDLASAIYDLGNITAEIGDKHDAERALNESRAILERMASENPTITHIHSNLAKAYNNLGRVYHDTGRLAEALASYEKARAIQQRLGREHPAVAEFQRDLGHAYFNMSLVHKEIGRTAEAIKAAEQSRTIRERLIRTFPTDARFQGDLAASHNSVGILYLETGRTAEALASYEKALTIQQRLAGEDPAVVQFQVDLGRTRHNIGLLQKEMGLTADAVASFNQASKILGRVVSENPSVTEFQVDLAETHNQAGILLRDSGMLAEALASAQRGLAIREKLVRQNPSSARLQNDLAASHNTLANVHRVAGRTADALASFSQAVAITERLAREHPESPDFASTLGGTLSNMALIDLREQRFDEAQTKIRHAIRWQRKALASNPLNPVYRQFLANHLTNLIRATEGLGHAEEAELARRQLAELAVGDPATPSLDTRLAAVLKGQSPRDDVERIQMALRAYEKSQHASAARLYAEALANNPKLGDDRQAVHRYNAARVAGLAASGQSKDDPQPDDAAKSQLRKQALNWLKAELSAWRRIAMTVGPGNKETVAKTLQQWKTDADLASIRDADQLAKLPEEERAAFQQLWDDVDRLKDKVNSP